MDACSITLYDANSNTLGGASSFTITVTEGTNNVAIPLVLGGYPKFVDVSASLSALVPATVPLTVTAYDADHNIIIGPAPYVYANGSTSPILVKLPIAIHGNQVTLHDGAQSSNVSISVAGPTDSPTVQLSAPADILGIPFLVTDNYAVVLPAQNSQVVAIPGTLKATQVGTSFDAADYTYFAQSNQNLATGAVDGFYYVYGDLGGPATQVGSSMRARRRSRIACPTRRTDRIRPSRRSIRASPSDMRICSKPTPHRGV
jgi:hypothetical protein